MSKLAIWQLNDNEPAPLAPALFWPNDKPQTRTPGPAGRALGLPTQWRTPMYKSARPLAKQFARNNNNSGHPRGTGSNLHARASHHLGEPKGDNFKSAQLQDQSQPIWWLVAAAGHQIGALMPGRQMNFCIAPTIHLGRINLHSGTHFCWAAASRPQLSGGRAARSAPLGAERAERRARESGRARRP